ncbi:MAG: hypothetical protein RJA70_2864 [Pseudomonadota bacterium]
MASALATASASLSAGLLGCSSGDSEAEAPDEKPAAVDPKDERVLVIGAGMAGLHCAYRLKQAGVDVHLYEASDRAGGRMFTGRGLFPNKQVCELGGEFIDSNHRFMLGLVEEFGLQLRDRSEYLPEGTALDTWFVSGKVIAESQIVEQFEQVAGQILADLEAADSDDDEYTRLDETSLATYLAKVVPKKRYPELHAVLDSAYRGEFGLETSEQSSLNLIYLIDAETADPFRIFGDSDERYHVVGGNDGLTAALASELSAELTLGRRLIGATKAPNGFRVAFSSGDNKQTEVSCERIVFALPFTTLRGVALEGLELSESKLEIIDQLGYGTNAKIMGGFSSPVWRNQHQASGSATTDLPLLQQVWDSSLGQPGSHAILTHFVSGEQGALSGEGSAEEWYAARLDDLDAVFPGAKAEYLEDSAVRMHWPSNKNTLGSYACYKPGQWAYWGTEGLPEGKVHFCGEHTSAEFQGWMEGAAETGGRVAVEILNALKLPLPKALKALVDDETALPDQMLKFASWRFPRRAWRALRTRP